MAEAFLRPPGGAAIAARGKTERNRYKDCRGNPTGMPSVPLNHIIVPFLLVLLNLLVETVDSAHVFDAYRLIQFDRNGKPFGSRRSQVYHMAAPAKIKDIPDPGADSRRSNEDSSDADSTKEESGGKKKRRSTSEDLHRKLVVVSMFDVNEAVLNKLIDKRAAAVVLIVLPTDLSMVPSETLMEWKKIEQTLLARQFQIPIYFAFDDERLQSMVKNLESGMGSSEPSSSVPNSTDEPTGTNVRYQLVAGTSDASLIQKTNIVNMHGWHRGPHFNGLSDLGPIVAITANFDTFAVAPGLAVGSDHNGSGTVALLELARIFGRLYSEFRTQGEYSILFVLTAAGGIKYEGMKAWMKQNDHRILANIEFVLCLENLASPSSSLYLHVSQDPKDQDFMPIINNFEDTAKHMDLPLEVIHTKLNPDKDSPLRWEHEQFARKNILTATLCNYRHPQPGKTIYDRMGSIFDRIESVDMKILSRNIKFVMESLSRLIYSSPEQHLDIASHSHAVNEKFVESWMSYLGREPRAFPFLSKDSEVVKELGRVLDTHTVGSKLQASKLQNVYKFYKSSTYKTTMTIYKVNSPENISCSQDYANHFLQVKPTSFDLLLGLAVVAYLLALHCLLKYGSISAVFTMWKTKKD